MNSFKTDSLLCKQSGCLPCHFSFFQCIVCGCEYDGVLLSLNNIFPLGWGSEFIAHYLRVRYSFFVFMRLFLCFFSSCASFKFVVKHHFFSATHTFHSDVLKVYQKCAQPISWLKCFALVFTIIVITATTLSIKKSHAFCIKSMNLWVRYGKMDGFAMTDHNNRSYQFHALSFTPFFRTFTTRLAAFSLHQRHTVWHTVARSCMQIGWPILF